MNVDLVLRMSAAALTYVLVTAVFWYWFRKKSARALPQKLLIGLIYGACSVAANHLNISAGSLLVLNVRDIGPLAAGLFFSPLSGLIAGFIGGAERILAGELWNIGRYTEIACGLSTFLAGVFAAVLNKFFYEGRRPSVIQSFFLGAVTEVFHMYAVLFTNRATMSTAYHVVQTVSLPMILFTAFGLALCSAAVTRLSGAPHDLGWRLPSERVPVTMLFQRSLLGVIVLLFAFNFITSYNLDTQLMHDRASLDVLTASFQLRDIYTETGSLEELQKAIAANTNLNYDFFLLDRDGNVIQHSPDTYSNTFWPEDIEAFLSRVEEDPFLHTVRGSQDKDFPDLHYPDVTCMCQVVSLSEEVHLVTLLNMSSVYENRNSHLLEDTLSDILLFTVLYLMVAMLADRVVVRNLHRVNRSLKKITAGDLNETVWVHSSAEFTDLSEDINRTVTALRNYTTAEQQRMKDELKMAATIQDAALPKNFHLPSANIELYALMTPAKQVGGDFYDFFYIGPDQLCLVIADVSGKGVPAALFMMRAKTAIKNNASAGLGPAEVLFRVNDILCEGNDAGMFVTVWLGILDLSTGRMRCANAGHEYPVLLTDGGEYTLFRDKHGLALAALKGTRVREYELQLNPGDRIFVYTDGVPEAINEKEEAYGTERMTNRLNQMKNGSEKALLESVLQDIRNFAGTAEQFDDITMLGLTYLNRPS